MHNEHNSSVIAAAIAQSFPLAGTLERLPGGEGRTYRAGAMVYRHETNHTEAQYVANVYHALVETGFRIPRPVRTIHGAWVSPDGWSGWTFVAGGPATTADVPAAVSAITAFHHALAHQPAPSYFAQRDTPFDRADRAAWGDIPDTLDTKLVPFVTQLMRFRRPLHGLPDQLIHGDLNEANIRIAPGLAPAIIDLTPYWRPPAFALAVLAYWLGPYQGNLSVLAAFAAIPHFDQMLVRVGLRTLLIAHECSQGNSISTATAAAFATPVAGITAWLEQQAGVED